MYKTKHFLCEFNGRCLLQGNVLINMRYLSLASLPLPVTVTMTLSHQVAVQQWRYTHRTLATPVVATASAVLRAALFPIMENLENALSETSTLSLDCVFCVWLVNSWEHMYVSTGYSYLVIFMLSSTR